jgi:hypothetical protein
MIDIPLDVLTKGFKIPLNKGGRDHQVLGQRAQIWQSFANTANQHIDAPQIDLAAAFRPIAQTLAHALLDALLQGGKEQMRMADQPFSGDAAGLLIMFEPAAQLAGGQRRDRQGLHQLIGMLTVGARQRRYHSACGPTRQPPLAHRGKSGVRQSRKQLQPSADPAHIAPATASDLVLRQSQALHQFADQQCLFDRRERTALSARYDPENGRGQVARPPLNTRGVATEPAQRGNAPIAVNQHQTLVALQNFDWRVNHRNAGDKLATALNGTGDPLDRTRLGDAGADKAQIQAMQVEIQALRVHGSNA